MKISMNLQKEPFEMIKNGNKIYELRLFDEKRKKIKVGDEIEFYCEVLKQKISVEVIDILIFKSFAELYASISPLEIGYTDKTCKTASPNDMLAYYTRQEEMKFGVVAIKIRV